MRVTAPGSALGWPAFVAGLRVTLSTRQLEVLEVLLPWGTAPAACYPWCPQTSLKLQLQAQSAYMAWAPSALTVEWPSLLLLSQLLWQQLRRLLRQRLRAVAGPSLVAGHVCA